MQANVWSSDFELVIFLVKYFLAAWSKFSPAIFRNIHRIEHDSLRCSPFREWRTGCATRALALLLKAGSRARPYAVNRISSVGNQSRISRCDPTRGKTRWFICVCFELRSSYMELEKLSHPLPFAPPPFGSLCAQYTFPHSPLLFPFLPSILPSPLSRLFRTRLMRCATRPRWFNRPYFAGNMAEAGKRIYAGLHAGVMNLRPCLGGC